MTFFVRARRSKAHILMTVTYKCPAARVPSDHCILSLLTTSLPAHTPPCSTSSGDLRRFWNLGDRPFGQRSSRLLFRGANRLGSGRQSPAEGEQQEICCLLDKLVSCGSDVYIYRESAVVPPVTLIVEKHRYSMLRIISCY